jgi:hypothetical protein
MILALVPCRKGETSKQHYGIPERQHTIKPAKKAKPVIDLSPVKEPAGQESDGEVSFII